MGSRLNLHVNTPPGRTFPVTRLSGGVGKVKRIDVDLGYRAITWHTFPLDPCCLTSSTPLLATIPRGERAALEIASFVCAA